MPAHPRRLEEPYRGRAVPPGSPRYLSWLFAAPPHARPAARHVCAARRMARSRSIPPLEPAAAHSKLAWWREEIERLSRGAPVASDQPLHRSAPAVQARWISRRSKKPLEAAARQIAGAPLEHGAELEAHARRCGRCRSPWQRASRVSRASARRASPRAATPARLAEAVHRAEAALGAAEYLDGALAGYQRAARFGRVVFPVDELLAASIEDEDLSAAEPPLHLQSYLEELRRRAVRYCLAGEYGAAELRARTHAAPAGARGARYAA